MFHGKKKIQNLMKIFAIAVEDILGCLHKLQINYLTTSKKKKKKVKDPC